MRGSGSHARRSRHIIGPTGLLLLACVLACPRLANPAPPPNIIIAYCGYLGGDEFENPTRLAVDANGSAYLATWTPSTQASVPVVVGPDLTAGGGMNLLVAKVRPDGTGFVYAGFVGGTGQDHGSAIAVDGSGTAHVGGVTEDPAFPVLIGPDLSFNGGGPLGDTDAFVAGIRPDGNGLTYAGYIGGADGESVRAMAAGAGDEAYAVGWTYSDGSSFPVAVGPDLTYNFGNGDAFVAMVRPDRTALAWAGYIGGTDLDVATDVTVDPAGFVYVSGITRSDPGPGLFPAVIGPVLTFGGADDPFVAKVRPDGTGLVYAGYVNGTHWDDGYGVAVDTLGAALVTGWTESAEADFPETVGPDLTHNGNRDAFVVKVRPDGTRLAYAGYIGGSGRESGEGVAADADGNALVVGTTNSDASTFPVLGGPSLTLAGGSDAFLTPIAADGRSLIHSGYIGGSAAELGEGVEVDPLGHIYVAGRTQSPPGDFPVVVGPDLTFAGNWDSFVAKLGVTACAALPGVIYGLLAVKAGTLRDDVAMTWQADLAANGYNVWEVAAKADVPLAREANQPPARGIAGCAPTPVGSSTCNDAGGVSRSPALRFYQVRAFCDALSEGP